MKIINQDLAEMRRVSFKTIDCRCQNFSISSDFNENGNAKQIFFY